MTSAHVADIRFVDQGAHTDLGEVGHLEQRGATRHGARGRGNHLAQRHRFVDNGPAHRRHDRRILQSLLREVQIRGGADNLSLRLRQRELCTLELRRGDHARLEHLVGALLGGFGDFDAGLRAPEVGTRLIVLVLHVARIHLHQQVAGAYLCSGFDGDLCDLTRRFRFHFDNVDRFHRAGRLRVDHDRAAFDGEAADREGGFLLGGARREQAAAENNATQQQGGRHGETGRALDHGDHSGTMRNGSDGPNRRRNKNTIHHRMRHSGRPTSDES